MLVAIVWVKGTVGLSTRVGENTSGVGWIVTHCIIACDELLAKSWVFVVDTRIDHCDVDASTADTQVPCTHWVDRGVACFNRRSLHIAVKHHAAVMFDHDNVREAGQGWGEVYINLTQQNCVHRFNHIIDGQVERLEIRNVKVVDRNAI